MSKDAASVAGDDARQAALLLAVDPAGLGGCRLRARAGPARDAWLALLRSALPAGTPWKRCPLHATDERLLGGLDLAATLAAGRPVAERGLLADADEGVLLLPSAERIGSGTAARICAAIDGGEVAAEREGFGLRHPARFGLVALDEGIEADERVADALADRMAFALDLDAPGLPPVAPDPDGAEAVASARALLPAIETPESAPAALCAAAAACGIVSLRAPLLALRAARASAALAGRPEPDESDLSLAARLVLAPRATRLPAEAAQPDDAQPPPPPPSDAEESDPEQATQPAELEDLVLAAIASALPPGLLERLRSGPAGGRPGGQNAGAGQPVRDRRRGRPAGSMRGEPKRGARLNLIETLRAAAPWQALRPSGAAGRLSIRRDDLRVTRFKRRSETTIVFLVDASGSAAFGRLAEAKGAVELLLADCYVRRDKVALMAFRGARSDLLLPPTRSLARAKRSLAELPGGGGTPLATAIEAGRNLADSVARAGGHPVLVFLSDGRANVARDGSGGRERATEEAKAAARLLAAARASVLFVDTSPRPHDAAPALADAMGARYLRLPAGDAQTLSGLVRRQIAGRA